MLIVRVLREASVASDGAAPGRLRITAGRRRPQADEAHIWLPHCCTIWSASVRAKVGKALSGGEKLLIDSLESTRREPEEGRESPPGQSGRARSLCSTYFVQLLSGSALQRAVCRPHRERHSVMMTRRPARRGACTRARKQGRRNQQDGSCSRWLAVRAVSELRRRV